MKITTAQFNELKQQTDVAAILKAVGAEVERLTTDRAKLIEAVEQFLAWFGSSSQWERENRNAKPVTRKDVKAMRDALRATDLTANIASATGQDEQGEGK